MTLNEDPTRCTERLFVILAKVSNGLEIGFEAVEQPHDFDVALAFGFEGRPVLLGTALSNPKRIRSSLATKASITRMR